LGLVARASLVFKMCLLFGFPLVVASDRIASPHRYAKTGRGDSRKLASAHVVKEPTGIGHTLHAQRIALRFAEAGTSRYRSLPL
jgi:hypothetical protein